MINLKNQTKQGGSKRRNCNVPTTDTLVAIYEGQNFVIRT
jgi:hypothetical protein